LKIFKNRTILQLPEPVEVQIIGPFIDSNEIK